jgi:hypothetical protein
LIEVIALPLWKSSTKTSKNKAQILVFLPFHWVFLAGKKKKKGKRKEL